ncbi:zinc finger transcriptional activator [Microbotryomycetes sp. JL221]|nr:zinc finger transcriptional activator [Microbotryomycetes sp. JL221]
MSAPQAPTSSSGPPISSDGPKAKRPKRTYRACLPCRGRKLKCDLGDPDAPSEGPCRRCRREQRECVFSTKPKKTYLEQGDSLSANHSGDESKPSVSYPHPPPAPPLPQQLGQVAWQGAAFPPAPFGGAHHIGNAVMSHAMHDGVLPRPPFFPSGHEPPPSTLAMPPPPVPQQARPQPPPIGTTGSEESASMARSAPGPIPLPPRSHEPTSAPLGNGSVDEEVDELEEDQDDDDDHGQEAETPRPYPDEGPNAQAPDSGTRKAKGPRDSDILLSSTLHNPSDALKLLATASSWRSNNHPKRTLSSHTAPSPQESEKASADATPGSQHAAELRGWNAWQPVLTGLVSQAEAEYLFKYFETSISPLYPLLAPEIFSSAHLQTLITTESLLLCAMIAIASRYNDKIERARADAIHVSVANFIRQELVYLQEGSQTSRNIGSVDALLLLTEWPCIPLEHVLKNGEPKEEGGNEEAAELLKTSAQYDSMSWTYIGIAVRLAQELGLDNVATYRLDSIDKNPDAPDAWLSERALRTWIFCYNADRHVSVRLGRNAVVQAYMSSAWWERVTQRASIDVQKQGLKELWAERTLPQGLLAALMGTIQERLYPNKDITRSLIRTGQWENFVRSLDHELKNMQSKTQTILKQESVQSTLLRIEIDYVRLYGNAIALRALQERLRRRVKANDLLFVRPSLLNLQEGPWIIDSLAAAHSILLQTVNFLWPNGYLRVCPARIFQRILFAATFLLKALAVGVIEHSQSKTMDLLDQAVSALHYACVDSSHHISRGFSALLSRLHAHCKPALLEQTGSIDPAANAQAHANGQTASSRPQTGQDAINGGPAVVNSHHPSVTSNATSGQGSGQHPLPNQHQQAVLAHSVPPFMPAFGQHAPVHGLQNGVNAHQTHEAPGSAEPSASVPHNNSGSQPTNLADAFAIAAAQAAKEHKMPVPLDPSTATWQPDMFGFELPFELDPTVGQSSVNREQDALFHSLYQSTDLQNQAAGNALLNVFGTLMGDAEFEF